MTRRGLTAPLPPEPSPLLPGLARVSRYWDAADGRWVAQVLPGDYCVTSEDEVLSTVLGSCVAACIRDVRSSFGGINHFMLPEQGGTKDATDALRYGCFAMERLVNELVKRGARRDDLEVKVFGGGKVIGGLGDVGRSNIAFVRAYLSDEGLPIVAEDVGGTWARRVRYYPATGRALVKRLEMDETRKVVREERRLKESLRPAAGSVELFGDD